MQRASDSWPWSGSDPTQQPGDVGERQSGGPSGESQAHTWWQQTGGKAHARSARWIHASKPGQRCV